MDREKLGQQSLPVLRIVSIYALFGSLWILFSDRLAGLVARNTSQITWISECKGLAFIALTSVLLYKLIRGYADQLTRLTRIASENEQRFRTIFDCANDAIFIHEAPSGRIVDVNQTMCSMFGYGREEAIRLSVEDLSLGESPYSQVEALEWIRRAQHGTPQLFEWLSRKKNGSLFWTEVNLRSANIGGYDRIIVLVRDISKRKEVEDRLRESEEKYRTLVETTGTGYVIIDPDGKVLDANREYVRLTGHASLADIDGRRVTEWTAPHDLARNAEEIRKCMEEGFVSNLEIDYVGPGQECIPVEINATVMQTSEGAKIITLCRDISARKQSGKLLQESENRYRLFTGLTSDYVYSCVRSGTEPFRIKWLGGAVEPITGYTMDEIFVKGSWLTMVHPDDVEQVGTALMKLRPGEMSNNEFRLVTKSGVVRWVHEICHCEAGDAPGELCLFGASQDVTERKLAERVVRESEKKYSSLFTSMSEGMALHTIRYDADGTPVSFSVVDINPAGEMLLGMEKRDVIGLDCSGFLDGALGKYFPIILRMAQSDESLSFEMSLDDGTRIFNVAVFYPETGMFATLFEDITERKRSDEKIQQLAYYDNLTGLPNRALLLDRCTQALARAARDMGHVAILFLDLDHFKVINDTLGHAHGDLLLVQAAQRLRESIRSSDTIARLGGDEFVILISSIGEEINAALTARQLLQKFKSPFVIANREIFTSVSIGISMFPEDGLDNQTLLRCADMAMYAAKQSGRNCYNFFSEEMNRKAHDRMQMETYLRRALEQEQFYLEFQPIVSAGNKMLAGAEVLIRWLHPELGLVVPDTFIPVAEQSGLIIPLGDWVLRTACNKMRAWHAAGLPPVKLSVNVSGRQFSQRNYADTVSDILQETGIDARFLELEMTETSLMEDIDSTRRTLQKLKEFNVGIVIDDFGAGYSSLGYLKNFPIDSIKIDRSFIRDLGSNANDRAIVEAIIAMAKKLGLKVVAEGVETSGQYSFLTDGGCDEIQGFYCHQPLPEETFVQLLRENTAPLSTA